MIVEALEPLTYRWPDGEVRLEPGKPVSIPDERARRLLAKAQGKVRPVEPLSKPDPGQVFPGVWVAWHSPLFGECTAQVAMAPRRRIRLGSRCRNRRGAVRAADSHA